MKEKLIIAGRTNWARRFYIKFKASEKSMLTIKKISQDLGSDYFVDNQVIPGTFGKYEKWKDTWIPIFDRKGKIEVDVICGEEYIHMIIQKAPSFEFINKILDKYCIWAEPEKIKKSIGLKKNKTIKNNHFFPFFPIISSNIRFNPAKSSFPSSSPISSTSLSSSLLNISSSNLASFSSVSLCFLSQI